MKQYGKILMGISLILWALVYMTIGVRQAAAVSENSIADKTRIISARTILGCDQATCLETRKVGVGTEHDLTVRQIEYDVMECLVDGIGAAATSGTALDPSSTASAFILMNETAGAGEFRWIINDTAAADNGVPVAASATVNMSGLSIASFSIYNGGAGAATATVCFLKKS